MGNRDRLFERFHGRGDVRALNEVFDATAPELYPVATHLARDLHDAEDLVLSTFLAAIDGTPVVDIKAVLRDGQVLARSGGLARSCS